MRKKAFTLIELLVVISIIALLLSIIMPSLSKARNQARDVVCRSNLRQWGVSFALYTNDYEGDMPLAYTGTTYTRGGSSGGVPSGAWYHTNTMGPYLPGSAKDPSGYQEVLSGGISVCPSHMAAKRTKSFMKISYSYNYWLRYPWLTALPFTNRHVHFKKDTYKGRRLVLVDGCHDRPTWATAQDIPDTGWVSYFVAHRGDLNYARHASKTDDEYSGRANILFGDWHVGSEKFEEDNPTVLLEVKKK